MQQNPRFSALAIRPKAPLDGRIAQSWNSPLGSPSGPYRFVRHPGYTGAIVGTSGAPLVLGSYWCFVPVVVVTLAFIVRAAYEDRLLRAELDGYDVYAARTGYRLCPFVW